VARRAERGDDNQSDCTDDQDLSTADFNNSNEDIDGTTGTDAADLTTTAKMDTSRHDNVDCDVHMNSDNDYEDFYSFADSVSPW
jgi:hypothetical protein